MHRHIGTRNIICHGGDSAMWSLNYHLLRFLSFVFDVFDLAKELLYGFLSLFQSLGVGKNREDQQSINAM